MITVIFVASLFAAGILFFAFTGLSIVPFPYRPTQKLCVSGNYFGYDIPQKEVKHAYVLGLFLPQKMKLQLTRCRPTVVGHRTEVYKPDS